MKRPFRRKRLDRWLKESIDSAKLFGLSREDGDEILFEAKRRFDAGEFKDALALYHLHIRAFGLNPDGLLGCAATQQSLGDIDAAIRSYRHALEHRPVDPFAWANVLECTLLLGHDEPAAHALAGLEGCDRAGLPPESLARIEALEALARERLRKPPSSGMDGSEVAPHADTPAYAIEPGLDASEFLDLLHRSTLADRRPVAEAGTIEGMIANAGLIVTARLRGTLVGVSRAITDFHYCTYLSDLAVDREFQKRGIGRELIRRTHEAAGLNTTLILLAAPAAREYYPHIGMTAHDSCWIIPRTPPPADGTPP